MKLDDYERPEMGIVAAKEMVQVIDKHLDGSVADKDDEKILGKALGHETVNSGAFRGKLADLKGYGLVTETSDRELTPLATELLENEPSAVRKIIDSFDLYRKAHEEFGPELPDLERWKSFLKKLNIDDSHSTNAKTVWKRYLQFSRKLQYQNSRDLVEISETEFRSNLERLEDEQRKKHAVDALKDLARNRIPFGKLFEKTFDILENNKYPEHYEAFVKIHRYALYSSSDTLSDEQTRDLSEFAVQQILEEEDQNIRSDLWDIITNLNPSHLSEDQVDSLWKTAKNLVEQGNQIDDEEMVQDANKIVRKLSQDWVDGRDGLIRDMEEDLWNEISDAGEAEETYGAWLRTFRKARGI